MNTRDYRASEYVDELHRMLDWPVGHPYSHERGHHAGRVRTLAWVVTGVDFGHDILDKRDEVRAYVKTYVKKVHRCAHRWEAGVSRWHTTVGHAKERPIPVFQWRCTECERVLDVGVSPPTSGSDQ